MKKFLALILSLAMLLSLAACSSNADTGTAAPTEGAGTESAQGQETDGGEGEAADTSDIYGGVAVQEGGTFVIGASGDPQSFNPDYLSDDYLWPIAQNMFNRLVKLTTEDTVIPDLAESYEFSEDGMTLTFHLREGVKWHDGVDFTSADVKWTYDTIIAESWNKSTSLESVESIECPDDNTVVFNLKTPDVTIISKLGWYGLFILPQHLYEGQDPATCEAATTDPVGTGPFKFESYETGVGVTLVKNEDYWGDEPNPDELIFAIYSDQDSMYQAFLNGEIDIMGSSVPVANVGDLDGNDAYRTFTQLAQNRTYITFNFSDPDFSKVEVRKAIELAIDREGIFTRVGGAGAAAEYYVSPLQTDYVDESITIPDRNVEEARALLESAGYTLDADGYYLHATLDGFESGNFSDIAQIVKANLAEVGIDLTINMMEYSAWGDKVKVNQNFSITMLAGYQGPDISGLAGRIQSDGSSNFGGYANERVDELFALSNVETDVTQRAAYYSEIQQIMADEVPMVFLLENGGEYAFPNNVLGTPYDLPELAASSEYTYLAFTAE